MSSKLIITTSDLRAQTAVTDLRAVLASTLLSAEYVLDPDTINQWLSHEFSLIENAALGFTKTADTDLFAFTDTPSTTVALGKSDSFGFADTPVFAMTFFRDFSDAFSLDDFTAVDAVIKDMANTKTNVFSFADDQAFGVGKGLSDSFGFADAFDSVAIGKGLVDTQSMTESLSRTVQYVRTFTDAFVLDDAATVDAVQKATSSLKQNIFAMGDVFGRVVSYNRGFSDNIAPVEQHVLTFSKEASADSFNVVEVFSRSVSYNRPFADSQGFGDAVDSQDLGKGLADTQALTEAHVSSVSLGKIDAVTLSESPASDVGKGLTDSVSMSESLARTVAYARSFADAFSMDDAATIDALVKDSSTAKSNVFGFSDVQEFGFGKTATDTFSFADDEEFEVGKGLSDSVTVTENFSFSLFSNAAMNAAPLNVSPFNE